jgi:hypothetical protein
VTDRVPSDHETIASHRSHVESIGRTNRPRLPLPDAVDAAAGDVLRLSLEGDTYHAQVQESLDGGLDVRGAFDNARLARADDEGENRFAEWAAEVGLSAGDAVLVDVVTPGFKLGVRRPGERVVYDATDAPSSSLSDIASDIDG